MNRKTEWKWALIFILVQTLWFLLGKLMGFHGEELDNYTLWNNLFALPAIAMVWMGLREKKHRDYGGIMSYGQGLSSGFYLSLFVGLFSLLATWIFFSLVSPGLLDNLKNQMWEQTPSGNVPELMFSIVWFALISFFNSLIMGLITSAVLMLFLRSRSRGIAGN